jgi:hypothetical protein
METFASFSHFYSIRRDVFAGEELLVKEDEIKILFDKFKGPQDTVNIKYFLDVLLESGISRNPS